VPGRLTVRFENVATPATALCDFVPPKVALPGLLPRAIVTWPRKLVTTWPDPSSAVTLIDPSDVTASVLAGCTLNSRLFGIAGAVVSEWHETTSSVRSATALARATVVASGRAKERAADKVERIPYPSSKRRRLCLGEPKLFPGNRLSSPKRTDKSRSLLKLWPRYGHAKSALVAGVECGNRTTPTPGLAAQLMLNATLVTGATPAAVASSV